MSSTLKTRKPVDKFTPADFDAFPVWEFASDEEGNDEQDETWVRPVKGSCVRLGEYSQLVAADFTTKSGVALTGFMTVTTADGPIEVTAGSIVSKSFYCALPDVSRADAVASDLARAIHARDELLSVLRLPEAEIFPIAFKLRVKIGNEAAVRIGVVE